MYIITYLPVTVCQSITTITINTHTNQNLADLRKQEPNKQNQVQGT